MTHAPFNIVQLLDKKRQGLAHTEAEIAYLVRSLCNGQATDYQISAWLMAVCLQGLNLDETTWLTKAFVDSGTVMDLSGVGDVVIDKHSTGGVGDKATLVLLPLLAAAGLHVAKLSGRGLGFTGGTIDKLEAIPGFRVALSTKAFISQIKTIKMAISSQTAELAPADAKMYALRDVTATVASIPLIAASVVSKKIAAGADVIVLDIKAGRGAFMKTLEEAQELAETCREVGKRLGRSISTVISTMDQPLGYTVGNAVEVVETIETLNGKGPEDLESLCLTLGGLAMVNAGRCDTREAAEALLRKKLHDGSAMNAFTELINAQDGDPEILTDSSLLPQPERISLIPSPQAGYVADIDPLKIAQAAKLMGAGRNTKEDSLNLGVGVVLHKKVGDAVEEGETLLELYVGENQHEATELLRDAITFSPTPVPIPKLIHEVSLGTSLSGIRA